MATDIAIKILETIVGSAVDAWGIQDDIWRLKATLPKIDILVGKAEKWRFRDANIPKLLSFLKDAAYDAEDLLDLFNYYILQKQIEDEQVSEYPKSLRSFIERLPGRVKGIQSRLDHASSQMQEAIEMLPDDFDNLAVSATSSMETGEDLLGRTEELNKIMGILTSSSAADAVETSSKNHPKRKRDEEQVSKVHIVPIVGMGGVGKTALARTIYNVKEPSLCNFDKRWVWVSEKFDLVRIINEIIGYTTERTNSTNVDTLQLNLRTSMSNKKFLLVLDDVWTENVEELNKLLTPLRTGPHNSVILVTTRSQNVAELIKTKELIHLEGLPDETNLELLNNYISGSNEAEHSSASLHDPELNSIALSIASKLKGSPLAAKTLGGVLKYRRDKEYWRSVMNSEIWELKQNENDIIPALQLSYGHLPAQLKKCFSFCSMFPKGFDFSKEIIIDLWIAHGFIAPEGNKEIRDIAMECFDGLKMRFFFEKSQRMDQYYVLHDLMHDLAHSVAFDECCLIHGSSINPNIPSTLRYLSVFTEKVEINELKKLCRFKKLRSLVVLNKVQRDLGSTMLLWFEHLTNIRCLKINACKMEELPSNVSNLKLLRYLDIPYAGERRFPKQIFKLYNLQFVHLQGWKGCKNKPVINGFSKLINLRIFCPIDKVISSISSSGKLSYLETVPQFTVQKETVSLTGQLNEMNQVHGSLCVRNLENLASKKHALRVGLSKKQYLDELILEWSPNTETNSDLILQVMEGLQPHSHLKILEIRQYSGLQLPAWLGNLSCLSILIITNCPYLCELPKIPFSLTELTLVNVGVTTLPTPCDDTSSFIPQLWSKSSALSTLHLEDCSKISALEDWLLAKYFPQMKSVCIKNCEGLMSFPANQIKNLKYLQTLKIISSGKINQQISLPQNISTLELDNSQLWDPGCAKNLKSIVNLRLHRCQIIENAKNLTILVSLRCLSLQDCEALCCLNGLKDLENLQSLSIIKCPKLCRPDVNKEEECIELKSPLQTLIIDNSTIIRLPILRKPPRILALRVSESDEELIFKNDENWLRNIRSLCLWSCRNLKSLPRNFHHLTKLKDLDILDCPNIKPPSNPIITIPCSITNLHFSNCHEELSSQLSKWVPPSRSIDFRQI